MKQETARATACPLSYGLAGIPMESIRHWVMHTGGQTVIDAAAASLGLDLPELEPTVRSLKRYGNQSSTSYAD